MSDFFADRLREAEIDVRSRPTNALASAASGFVSGLTLTEVPDLVRLAFGQGIESGLDQRLREAMRSAEESFPLRGADHELSVIAAHCLAEGLDTRDGDVRLLLALATRTAHFGGLKPAHDDVLTRADTAWALSASASTAQPAPPKALGRPTALKQAFDATATDDWTLTRTAAIELDKEVSRLRAQMNSLVAFTEAARRPMEDQVDVMWWLLSGWSFLLQCPLGDVALEAVPVVVGLELADRVKTEPGPPAADELLRQALLISEVEPDEDVELSSVKDALDGPVIALLADFPNELSDLLPLRARLTAEARGRKKRKPAANVARETFDELMLVRTAGRTTGD